jgi:hypothetical protein
VTDVRDQASADSPSPEGHPAGSEVADEGAPGARTDEMVRPVPFDDESRDEWLQRLAVARWSALRPTKVQIAALVLLTVFALGPLVALTVVLRADTDPSKPVLVSASLPPGDGAAVVGTITRVDAVSGEMAVRLLVLPQSDLLDDGLLAEPLELRVNDARGSTSVLFADGEVPGPVDVLLALSGGSISRYPFDSYDANLALVLTRQGESSTENGAPPADPSDAGEDGDTEEASDVSSDSGTAGVDDPPTTEASSVPIVVDLVTTVTDFEILAAPEAETSDPSSFTVVPLTAGRSTTTTVYAMGIMALMWGLAVTGVFMAWAVVIWRVETPMWVYGYFVGVLFALPPLREALPGRPPPGTLVDYAAFYWSIGIIGVTLLLMMSLWIRRSRPEDRPRLFRRDPHALPGGAGARVESVDPGDRADSGARVGVDPSSGRG